MKRGWIYGVLMVAAVLVAICVYEVGVLSLALDLLVQSFWGILVPAALWIWQWIVVFLLVLVAGGIFVPPLIVEGTRKLYRQFQRHCPMQVVICVAAALLGWLWIHLWTATAILWEACAFPHGDASPVSVIAVVACGLSAIGLWGWWLANK